VSAHLPDPEKTRRNVGLVLYLIAQLVGGGLLLLLFLLPALVDIGVCGAMCLGAGLAIPAGVVYLTVPRLLDRYDPEPWYALIGCLLWGGIAACGFSAVINSVVSGIGHVAAGEQTGDALSAVVSAPIVEELFKAMGVGGVYYFLRREFDGIVDGIIYATFVALGFATVENIIYYTNAAGEGMLGMTFIMRGILFPWGHPVYTAMTGIGFGIARETEKNWLRAVAPLGGYLAAVVLHAMWNGSATLADAGESGQTIFCCMLPLWFTFVATFMAIVVVLVRRRGRIIRQFLEDEVALGNLTQEEATITGSAFGLMRARSRWGNRGVELVRAAARLALSKWHSTRAHKTKMSTVSWEFIVPLRQRIKQLRAEIQQEEAQRRYRQQHRR